MTAEADRGAESSGGGQKKEGSRELHGQQVFIFLIECTVGNYELRVGRKRKIPVR